MSSISVARYPYAVALFTVVELSGSASIAESKTSGSPKPMKATGPESLSNEILNWSSDGCTEEYNAVSSPPRKFAIGSILPSIVLGITTLTSPAASAAPRAA